MQSCHLPAMPCDVPLVKQTLVVLIAFLLYVEVSSHYTSQNFQYSTPEECNRVCNDTEPPKICYYRFHIEFYTTVGRACDVRSPECILADGVEKTVIVINRSLPGPSIRVCKGDRVVADVDNAAEGIEMTIHWHGLFQRGSQIYDGVPFVTQCPIAGGNTFRYNFVAANSGTHFYHSHSASYEIDGVYGSFVIRDPPNLDPMRKLYDEDRPEHEIILGDWFHELSLERFPGRYRNRTGQTATNFLINGKGDWTDPVTKESSNAPLASFTVKKGKKYRFRVINAFGTVCASRLSIQGHNLTIIAQDGDNIVPVFVTDVHTRSGNRVDFVLYANQPVGVYWIKLTGLGECAETNVTQYALLKYEGAGNTPKTPKSGYNAAPGVSYNSLEDSNDCTEGDTNNFCISSLHSVEPVPKRLLNVYPDQFFVMSVGYFDYTNRTNLLFGAERYNKFFVAPDRTHIVSLMAGRSFIDPPSPLISQKEAYSTVCEGNTKPKYCPDPCFCTSVYHIELGSLVEILIYDNNPADLEHPIHLHGYAFNVLDMGRINGTPTEKKLEGILTRHIGKLKQGKYRNPSAKDTISIPSGGYAIIRFIADNPGWWLMHCHFLWHTMTGMNIVLHVGDDEDMPAIPRFFPKCYNWLPPVY